MIDRRSDQLGKVLVCVHAVTIQHRGRATRSIDHDTHGHRLGQSKAQTGFERRWVLLFEGSQEARALALGEKCWTVENVTFFFRSVKVCRFRNIEAGGGRARQHQPVM